VLILSEFAGSAQSLSGAIRVNPWNTEQLASAIKEVCMHTFKYIHMCDHITTASQSVCFSRRTMHSISQCNQLDIWSCTVLLFTVYATNIVCLCDNTVKNSRLPTTTTLYQLYVRAGIDTESCRT
jgi:predicted O-linked N-acetylglucosamine transferase (SPINDLY family)